MVNTRKEGVKGWSFLKKNEILWKKADVDGYKWKCPRAECGKEMQSLSIAQISQMVLQHARVHEKERGN